MCAQDDFVGLCQTSRHIEQRQSSFLASSNLSSAHPILVANDSERIAWAFIYSITNISDAIGSNNFGRSQECCLFVLGEIDARIQIIT
jgi:hypothetical protein